jgi:hypothetical protein
MLPAASFGATNLWLVVVAMRLRKRLVTQLCMLALVSTLPGSDRACHRNESHQKIFRCSQLPVQPDPGLLQLLV